MQCGLCTRPNVTLSHILAGCPWVLTVENKLDREDRNTWRHNNILLELAVNIQQKIREVNLLPSDLPLPRVHFVPAGTVSRQKFPASLDLGLLKEARDWVCDFDLPDFHTGDSKYCFLQNIDVVDVRCDGYIISRSKKICIIIELTVPMEENIEYWHSEKRNRYSKITSPDWSFHYLIFEIGCRGFIPTRFFSLMRHLGFTKAQFRRIYTDLQLLVRRCSYVIWLNRYNKEFVPFRFSVLKGKISRSPLTTVQLTRAETNRAAALVKLQSKKIIPFTDWRPRASANRIAALNILESKKASASRALPVATVQADRTFNSVQKFSSPLWKAKQKTRAGLPKTTMPTGFVAPDITSHVPSIRNSKWSILPLPGLSLVNTLNKCWFHTSLHFLSCIPYLRDCLGILSYAGTLEKYLFNALHAILHSHRRHAVHALFNEVKDFNGRDNRYGQIAVPDFLDYLCTQVSKVGQALRYRYFTRLLSSAPSANGFLKYLQMTIL